MSVFKGNVFNRKRGFFRWNDDQKKEGPDAPVINSIEYISTLTAETNLPEGGEAAFNLPITKNGNYLVTVHGTYRQVGVSAGGCMHTIDRTGSSGPRQYVVVPITTEVSIFNQRLVTITDFNTQTIVFNFNGASNDCSLLNVVVSALIL